MAYWVVVGFLLNKNKPDIKLWLKQHPRRILIDVLLAILGILFVLAYLYYYNFVAPTYT